MGVGSSESLFNENFESRKESRLEQVSPSYSESGHQKKKIQIRTRAEKKLNRFYLNEVKVLSPADQFIRILFRWHVFLVQGPSSVVFQNFPESWKQMTLIKLLNL